MNSSTFTLSALIIHICKGTLHQHHSLSWFKS